MELKKTLSKYRKNSANKNTELEQHTLIKKVNFSSHAYSHSI